MNRQEAKKRATELVAKMTLEEKASQLRFDAPAIERLGIPEYNWWNEALHGVARAGTATMFPQSIALASTFDEDLLYKVGEIISNEGRAKYNMQSKRGDRDIYKGLTFWSPNVNIFRDPRWGRGHETYGEDPYLTSRMGVQFRTQHAVNKNDRILPGIDQFKLLNIILRKLKFAAVKLVGVIRPRRVHATVQHHPDQNAAK